MKDDGTNGMRADVLEEAGRGAGEAERENVVLRLLGGVAIKVRAPEEPFPKEMLGTLERWMKMANERLEGIECFVSPRLSDGRRRTSGACLAYSSFRINRAVILHESNPDA